MAMATRLFCQGKMTLAGPTPEQLRNIAQP
jgi:hypothetical protein